MVDQVENSAETTTACDDQDELKPMPRLLELGQSELISKTRELKARGEQLDLLLLKAESYSHFIRMNQEQNERETRERLEQMQRRALEEETKEESGRGSGKKRLRGGGSPVSASPGKRQKGAVGAGASGGDKEAAQQVMSGCTMSSMITAQPPNLVGGTLKPYQLDGLRWLVSLWENGLSGILG